MVGYFLWVQLHSYADPSNLFKPCQVIPRRKTRKTDFNSVSMWPTLGKMGLSYSKLPQLYQSMHSVRPPLYTSCRSGGLGIFESVIPEPQVLLALLPKFRGEAALGLWMRSQRVAGLRFYSRFMRDLYWSRDTDLSFPEEGSWENVAKIKSKNPTLSTCPGDAVYWNRNQQDK